MILITGASGNLGSAVLREVLDRKLPVKAMYRSQQEAARAPAGVETAIADFANAASMRAALKDIEKVYLVCAAIPQLVDLERNATEACREAGIQHVVLQSALGVGVIHTSFPSWHERAENALKESGIKYTMLRPNSFMQNIAAYNAPTIRQQAAFYGTYGDGRISHIDVRDIAAVAATVLASDPHVGKTYELNGPDALSSDELARRISRVVGSEVHYVDLPSAEMKRALASAGMPEWLVNALVELQEYYRNGNGGQTDTTVRDLIGREPRTVDQYLNENAAAFTRQRATA